MNVKARLATAITLGLASASLTPACEPTQKNDKPVDTTPEAGASPNASILPAPLAPLATEAPEPPDAAIPDGEPYGLMADPQGRLIVPEAGAPPPEPLRGDQPIPAEPPQLKDLPGITLEATFRFRNIPNPPKAPEVSQEGIKAAQNLTAPKWKIDLAESGRMRIEFNSRAMPLPMRSELRARTDRYGHIVLWPNATDYRVAPPGALRTVLGERRVDVTPLSQGTVKPQGEGKRLNLPTRKIEITTSLGSAKLELGKTTEVGEGGPLLCRTLVEIIGVDPKTTLCTPNEVPLSAAYTWQDGGGIDFEITQITRRTDLPTNDMLVPPPGATHQPTGLPTSPGGVFLTREEVAALRSTPLQLPPPTDPKAPGEGFIAVNTTDTLAFLLLDGIPILFVPPNEQRYVIGTTRGRYTTQWRTFLGDRSTTPTTTEMPARILWGDPPDAGTPDGG